MSRSPGLTGMPAAPRVTQPGDEPKSIWDPSAWIFPVGQVVTLVLALVESRNNTKAAASATIVTAIPISNSTSVKPDLFFMSCSSIHDHENRAIKLTRVYCRDMEPTV